MSDYGDKPASEKTLHDEAALRAMQGLLSNLAEIRQLGFKDHEIEEFALMRADALIAELQRRQQEQSA